jgi:hypothetical protein
MRTVSSEMDRDYCRFEIRCSCPHLVDIVMVSSKSRLAQPLCGPSGLSGASSQAYGLVRSISGFNG